jgi:PRTRC genetic system protein A
MKIRGHFISLAEMAKDVHPVNIVMGHDGLYEIRVTPVGIFSKKVNYLLDELDRIREGFVLTLPKKIPSDLLAQAIAFFRRWGQDYLEAQVQIFWNTKDQQYFVYVPKQDVSCTEVTIERNPELEKFNVLALELHSHHHMPAIFSAIDDDWEKATGLYGVIGRIEEDPPQASFRYSCGGEFFTINLRDIFQDFSSEIFSKITNYPKEWDSQVTVVSGEGERKQWK